MKVSLIHDDGTQIIVPWFKVWTRWEEVIDRMTDQQAGRLLKSIMLFVTTQTEPNFDDDDILSTSWAFMKSQIAFDLQKYINQVKHNREAGRTSAKTKAKKRKKTISESDENLPTANADGTRDRQQVLTSANEDNEVRSYKKDESVLNFLNPDNFDMDTNKDFLISQRAVDILKKQLGEKLTEAKMNVVTKFIREHDSMNDLEIASGVKYKLQNLTEADEE